MDGTYMTNGEVAAIQVESNLEDRIKRLERRVYKLEQGNKPILYKRADRNKVKDV